MRGTQKARSDLDPINPKNTAMSDSDIESEVSDISESQGVNVGGGEDIDSDEEERRREEEEAELAAEMMALGGASTLRPKKNHINNTVTHSSTLRCE